MKYQFSSVVAMLASTAAAHSWLECVDADLPGREEMVANPPGPFDFPIKYVFFFSPPPPTVAILTMQF